jgi:hypothetical protein
VCISQGFHKIDQQLLLECSLPSRHVSKVGIEGPIDSGWLTSRNRKAFPSPASGANARKLVTSSSEGVMACKVCCPVESSKE